MSGARQFVLLTGAAGRIGSAFRADHGERYRFRLADLEMDSLGETPGSGHEVIALDVGDAEACRKACSGVDCVVHLAADPDPEADFDGSLLHNNVIGTYNIFRAAKEAGCRRVVFASSVHAVIGYPPAVQARTDDAVSPENMYGVSKCFGEAVAACFAAAGVSSIAIRIGAYEAPWIKERPTPDALAMYVSPRDLNQLLVRCLETPGIDFAIVHGVSNNRFQRLDLSTTRALLGYEPQDDGFQHYGVALEPAAAT